MAYAFPDLHPDDHTARVQVRDRLVAARHTATLSRPALAARLGVATSTIQSIEEGTDRCRASTLQRYARALNLRMVFHLDDLPDPNLVPDPLADVWQQMLAASPDHEDEIERRLLRLNLIRCRQAAGISREQQARTLGLARAGLSRFEYTATGDIAVHVAQRYARALGGRVRPVLEAIPPADQRPGSGRSCRKGAPR